jgi:hypothetical protein
MIHVNIIKSACKKSITKEYGESVFGKALILKGRRGSVLVWQHSSNDMYQVFNLGRVDIRS